MNHKLWDLNNKTRWYLVPTIANNCPFWQFRNVLQQISFKSLFLGLQWWYKYENMRKRKLGISSTQRYIIHGYTKKKCWFSSVLLSGTRDKKTRRDFSPRKQSSCALARYLHQNSHNRSTHFWTIHPHPEKQPLKSNVSYFRQFSSYLQHFGAIFQLYLDTFRTFFSVFLGICGYSEHFKTNLAFYILH